MTVAPCRFSSKMPSKILLRLWGSTDTVGSSKIISLGLCAIPHAMFNLLSKPPLSFGVITGKFG